MRFRNSRAGVPAMSAEKDGEEEEEVAETLRRLAGTQYRWNHRSID
jgi:hypothetical protein